jgi:hypothetical protein
MSLSVSEYRVPFSRRWLKTWLTDFGTLRLAILLGLVTILARLPWLFTTLGEQDHGMLIVDAIVYATIGRKMEWAYAVLTSPLWTLPVAAVVKLFGTAHLMMVTNVGGLLCAGATTALAFVLLRKLGARRGWAAAGALATELAPGTFYPSLYGYPSQYALPLLLASAVAFAHALETERRKWMVLAGVFYCGVALMKIDFALAGTLLFSVAIMQGKTFDRRTWLLLIFPLVAFAVSAGVGCMALEGKHLLQFLSHIDEENPWSAATLVDSHVSTIFYACGFGTLGVFATTLIAGLARRELRGKVRRIAIAWAVGALPLILFWLARPPMSSRHAMPGVMMTAIIAALMASYVLPRFRYAPVVWLIGLVASNWPFGTPGYDVNYRPSGNLAAGVLVNRRAFAVAHDVARSVAERKEAVKAIIGRPRPDVLGSIDIVQMILVEMGARSTSVRSVDMEWTKLAVFTDTDGWTTKLFLYLDPVRATNLTRMRRVGYYVVWPYELELARSQGLKVVSFDPNDMYQRTSGEYIWR